MFKIESYVTPILLSYVDKYVKDFKPADAQVSLWGGGVVLHNLVLKTDVLQQEFSLPFSLVSGRIHELLIQVPWTKIMSEPIVVTIDTIECILSQNPVSSSEDSTPSEAQQRRPQVVEAPPGYMQALVRRIVSNISLKVHHLILKYVADDIVMSVNVNHLAVDSAGVNWEPAFADIDQNAPVLRRLIRLDDLTLCLDNTDSDGKIRFYQEPLLYKCQLNFRVLTRLASATTRRAIRHYISLRSSKLAWGVTNDQLLLLLRLAREQNVDQSKQNRQSPRPPVSPASHSSPSNVVEPNNDESWSEWAWSWLPMWMDKDMGVEEAPIAVTPCPFHFVAYLDTISLVFKVMEKDSNGKKRARGVLEFVAKYAALKGSISAPILYNLRLGARSLRLFSTGKCVCGLFDVNGVNSEPTIYMKKICVEIEEPPWEWPEDDFEDTKIETPTAEEVDEHTTLTEEEVPQSEPTLQEQQGPPPQVTIHRDTTEKKDDGPIPKTFWDKLETLILFEFLHERSPPENFSNLEVPPKDFEYSDWVEQCTLNIKLEPIVFNVSLGLIHRIESITRIFKEIPNVSNPEPAMRTLTVEECESLFDNLPQKRINFECRNFLIRFVPLNHDIIDRVIPPPIYLDFEVPLLSAVITTPLYPHRVCSAACQMPRDDGPMWQGARTHVTVSVKFLQASISSPSGLRPPRPIARLELTLVMHCLLYEHLFNSRESVKFSYSLKIREANLCGSAARLRTAFHVVLSLAQSKRENDLKYTYLANDGLHDEDAVAIDMTLEDLSLRGFVTRNINTHIMMMHSARAMALHSLDQNEVKQSWIFSAPDIPTTTPCLRLAVQWCEVPSTQAIEFIGVWTETIAVCLDPMLIAWLTYKPRIRVIIEPLQPNIQRSSSIYSARRRTPPSSSGRGVSRSGSGAELIHSVRTRSAASSSEPSERKEFKGTSPTPCTEYPWWVGDRLLALHNRLRHMLLNMDFGLIVVYFTMTTVSAIGCATVQDALEIHATKNLVLVFSLGRLSIHSNALLRQMWNEVRHDGPTIFTSKTKFTDKDEDCFPWRIRIADASCYTLDMKTCTEKSGKEKAAGMRSQLRVSSVASPRTILEMLTTTLTVSVVTKTMTVKQQHVGKKPESVKKEPSVIDESVKYFSTGLDFKPSSLKEFVRGPARRRNQTPENNETVIPPPSPETTGPVVSLGVCLHADTPPILMKMDYDQVHIITAAFHCFKHIKVLSGNYEYTPKNRRSQNVSRRALQRSVSDAEINSRSELSQSEHKSEMLISIFESQDEDKLLRPSFWFQWVISRVSIMCLSDTVKLDLNIDDVITTVDIQKQYRQLKVKLSSVSVRHYERDETDEWSCGLLGGRILEVREPIKASDENHFLAITITQAEISSLPDSWKEELHPKMLQSRLISDSMWEIYATMAPLEAVLKTTVLDHVLALVYEMTPRAYCPLPPEIEVSDDSWQWPFCFISAGGLRLLVASESEKYISDDTFMLSIGKIIMNPHPENPICRRSIVANNETWLSGGGNFEGRQYEVTVKNISIHSAKFYQLVNQEMSENELQKIGVKNPALKWAQPPVSPVITPLLHAMEINCVLAPAFYMDGTLSCGPAVELNVTSDLAFEINMEQLKLMKVTWCEFTNTVLTNLRDHLTYDDERHGICPYAQVIRIEEIPVVIPKPDREDNSPKYEDTLSKNISVDSGMETGSNAPSTSKHYESILKKNVSVGFIEEIQNPSDYMEFVVTFGTVELSLYTHDDNTPLVASLRHVVSSNETVAPSVTPPMAEEVLEENHEECANSSQQNSNPNSSKTKSKCSSEQLCPVNNVAGKIDLSSNAPARKGAGMLPLLHMTMYQPNLYFWKQRSVKNLQVSLFNAWIGLGAGPKEGIYNEVLFSTASGVPDPLTDIPPALASMKMVLPMSPGTFSGMTAVRGNIQLDVERPIMLEVSLSILKKLKGIATLIKTKTKPAMNDSNVAPHSHPFLYKLRHMMGNNGLESISINTTQIALSGANGTIGFDNLSLQIAASNRPERLVARSLVTAFLITVGAPGDRRHPLLQPFMFGVELECNWEAWRRAEGGKAAEEPSSRLCIDLDHIDIDFRPSDLTALFEIQQALKIIVKKNETNPRSRTSRSHSEDAKSDCFNIGSEQDLHKSSFESCDSVLGDHFYKDDLRSGAFKILNGGQLPMAYQIILHDDTVSWRYPHPRAITRIVAFPLPNQSEELDCVLEQHSNALGIWVPHVNFKLPLYEQREVKLHVSPPDTIFGPIWRFRIRTNKEDKPKPHIFEAKRYMYRTDPLATDSDVWPKTPETNYEVTAEQLCGALRVDSYFNPLILPSLRMAVHLLSLNVHIHNTLPKIYRQKSALEGIYVSKPLMRSHRVLSLHLSNTSAYCQLASMAGNLILIDTIFSSKIVESATGTFAQFMNEARLHCGVSVPIENECQTRFRFLSSLMHFQLHIPRLRTLQSLVKDWKSTLILVNQRMTEERELKYTTTCEERMASNKEVIRYLEGRVCLWIYNNTVFALRVGQEGTEESLPLGSGLRLAYRWRSPKAPKELRFALAGPSTVWHWSNSMDLSMGHNHLRMEKVELLGANPNSGLYLYTNIEGLGAAKTLTVSGRFTLANMLRHTLLFKIRARCSSKNTWVTMYSSEINAETIGSSILCSAECDLVLKIKFSGQEVGWSGDIPLRECPKENVPWLVKVPSDGDFPYFSVWCRVVRATSDRRIIASIWPLYVMYSHLPLAIDVTVTTQGGNIDETLTSNQFVQSALGCGRITHLILPGTTAATHKLHFQYKNIDTPVTRDVIPLHYGVTNTSVFDKKVTVSDVQEVINEINVWLDKSNRLTESAWPYSIVSHHKSEPWTPALLQPRSDIAVRYSAIQARGGCSLEIELMPVALFCNASTVALTLRAHDAAPLCKIEPSAVLSPQSVILTKPFFISVEVGRDTFVSGELEIWKEEVGRYGSPPLGRVALDNPALISIHCHQKVLLLTLYYELKQDINVLGISSTHVIFNRIDTPILVSAIVVPIQENAITIKPRAFRTIHPFTAESDCAVGVPLCNFWVYGRWRGGDTCVLQEYLCIALPDINYDPTFTAVPICLRKEPYRRAISLRTRDNNSFPVVVTQHRVGGRWLITVSKDPCPQFLIHNKTNTSLCVAQPILASDEPSTSTVEVTKDCEGVRWFSHLVEGHLSYYSTPSHCARYPQSASAPHTNLLPFLTFGLPRDDFEPKWCPPVAITNGEQLVQISEAFTIKLRISVHPHSTFIELLDVDVNDISASDIRRRLQTTDADMLMIQQHLERIDAREKLFQEEIITYAASQREFNNTNVMTTMLVRDETGFHSVPNTIKVTKSPSVPSVATAVTLVDNRSCDTQRTNGSQTFSTALLGESNMYVEEKIRASLDGITVEFSVSSEVEPLIVAHLDNIRCVITTDDNATSSVVSIADIQVENRQYDEGHFDFAVVFSTCSEIKPVQTWPTLWNILTDNDAFIFKYDSNHLTIRAQFDQWGNFYDQYTELTELEINAGPVALYIEDAYISAVVELLRWAVPKDTLDENHAHVIIAETESLHRPLRLRLLLLHPMQLTLTLHTAARMYIALDQSPLHLNAFRMQDMMTSTERLTHALTVHYLSAAILGAGWVVAGLELLGAPGALAARVGGATGGVRGVATATAAAVLRSLSAWADSLARNLDILAGDEEHTKRAAAARRRPPDSLVAGLKHGFTNFAINILGAVGGLAHHPLVGIAVGESESSVLGLRRGIVGALTKPLSATADLVALAGHGLLKQTGWDPVPQSRAIPKPIELNPGWERDCVRWSFRLAELTPLAGFTVLLDDVLLQIMLTHKFMVIADPETEKVSEMVDFKFCTIGPYVGPVIQITVVNRRLSRDKPKSQEEEIDFQMSAAAMARVARYTGAESSTVMPRISNIGEVRRVVTILPAPGKESEPEPMLPTSMYGYQTFNFKMLTSHQETTYHEPWFTQIRPQGRQFNFKVKHI